MTSDDDEKSTDAGNAAEGADKELDAPDGTATATAVVVPGHLIEPFMASWHERIDAAFDPGERHVFQSVDCPDQPPYYATDAEARALHASPSWRYIGRKAPKTGRVQ